MGEPLKITEADVGRIVYVEADDLITDAEVPIDTEMPIDTAAVILQEEDTRELGFVFLRWPWKDRSLRITGVKSRRLYATQADAVTAGVVRERRDHDLWRHRIVELERAYLTEPTTP